MDSYIWTQLKTFEKLIENNKNKNTSKIQKIEQMNEDRGK